MDKHFPFPSDGEVSASGMLRPSVHEQAERLVWGFTPLITAVANKNLAVVTRLLAAGASVFVERRRDPRVKGKNKTAQNYESTAINYAQVSLIC